MNFLNGLKYSGLNGGEQSVEQNLPTFILLDNDGKVVFKYISQHTIDRPTSGYLLKIMDALIKN